MAEIAASVTYRLASRSDGSHDIVYDERHFAFSVEDGRRFRGSTLEGPSKTDAGGTELRGVFEQSPPEIDQTMAVLTFMGDVIKIEGVE